MRSKVYESKDGKLQVRSEEVTHVCVAPNIYPLLQYLLLMDDKVAFHHSFYFFNDTVPENVRDSLPSMECKYVNKTIVDKIMKRVNKVKLRFFKYSCFPFLRDAEIYAYDIPYLSLCIGNRTYSLLADAPNWLTRLAQDSSEEYRRNIKHANSFLGRIQGFFWGDVYIHYKGGNKQCKAIYLTEENTSPVLEGKEVFVQSFNTLWSESSERKKTFIKDVFDVTNEDVVALQRRPNIFFSQPLMKDCKLTEAEYVKILTGIFQNYPLESLIVKLHPRDRFNYKKYFPEIEIYSKPVNVQILYIMGLSPQKVITIFSTAVDCFPESIECDYYGTTIHPKIEAFAGKDYKPGRKVNHIKSN